MGFREKNEYDLLCIPISKETFEMNGVFLNTLEKKVAVNLNLMASVTLKRKKREVEKKNNKTKAALPSFVRESVSRGYRQRTTTNIAGCFKKKERKKENDTKSVCVPYNILSEPTNIYCHQNPGPGLENFFLSTIHIFFFLAVFIFFCLFLLLSFLSLF